MLKEDPLLALGPCYVIRESVDLNLSAVGNGCKEVEKCTNFEALSAEEEERNKVTILSLAVLAFAVEDMKARESVITSASPFAFLVLPIIRMNSWLDQMFTFGPGIVLLA